MADDPLNALLQANRSTSVLQGIANPVLVNPLAAINSATQAAGNVFDLRAKQAQQAWGQALQQATDENGNVDYAKAQSIARNDPLAAMGMATNLANNAQLRTAQLNNIAGHMKLVGTSAITVAQDPSDANVNASFDNLIANGSPRDQVERERARWLGMSPAERQQNAYRVGQTALEQLHQVIGQTVGQNVGGQIVPMTTTQPTPRGPGAIVQGPGAINTTASPDTVVSMPDAIVPATVEDVRNGLATAPGQDVHISGAERMRRFGNSGLLPPGAREVPGTGGGGGGGGGGVVDSTGKLVSPTNPPRLLNVPGQPPAATPAPPGGATGASTASPAVTTPPGPPAPPGGPSGASSAPYTGGGIGAVLSGSQAAPAAPLPLPPTPPASPPPAPAAAVPPPPAVAAPPPASNPPPPPNAPRASLQGGVPIAAANALLAPSVGPAGGPNPLVPGDVAAIAAGMDRARGAGATPGTQQAASGTFATGPGYTERANAAASAERLVADDKLAANYAGNVFPQTQALSLLGRGMTTAPGSDLLNEAKGWAGGVARSMGYSGAFDETKEYDSLHKWLSQIVAGNPVAQGSDARLAATLAGNANTGIHELASSDMLKAGIAMMRMNATASSEWHTMSPAQQAQYGYYNDFLRDFNKNVDPRAFAWDLYNPQQKKTLLDDINSHDEAYAQKLMNSREMARRNGYLGETRAMP